MKYYMVIAVLILLLVPLQVSLWSDDGVSRWYELKQLLSMQKKENLEMKQRNQKLKLEVFDLKEGKDAIENMAREESQMIKKGETFYRIIRLPKEEK